MLQSRCRNSQSLLNVPCRELPGFLLTQVRESYECILMLVALDPDSRKAGANVLAQPFRQCHGGLPHRGEEYEDVGDDELSRVTRLAELAAVMPLSDRSPL